MKTVIEVKNLSKTYKMGTNDVEVLKNVDLKIESGEFISIMGPSGSGKSTLLYLMGGLDKTTSGYIKINGKDISTIKDKEASKIRNTDIGFIFQFYNLIPNLDVEENIMIPVLLSGRNAKEYKERLDEILEIVSLSDRRRHTPRELSGGQQQRVAIARALINDPDVILADEPIGNLDTKTGSDVMQLLKKINKEKGKTIIQVTHSKEASEYGNRVINIRDGSIFSDK